MIRRARERGINVTAEVTPHHLTLTDAAALGFDTNTKVAPPLRSDSRPQGLPRGPRRRHARRDRTDHAPHAVHEKDLEFTQAPPGMIGFETALALVLDLVRQGELTPLELVRRLSTNPARILRRAGGSLAPGAPGDVVVVDPERRWTYDPAKGYSKSRNSPWAGQTLTGRVRLTFVAGRLVFDVERGVVAP